MMRFKNRTSTFSKPTVLLAAFALLLAGCFKPQSRDQFGGTDASNASFAVGKLSLNGSTKQMLEGFSIPESKQLSFGVCVNNSRTGDPIRGHKFTIENQERKQELTSDQNGCLSWVETLKFNFLAEEKYVSLKWRLTARGMETGTRNLEAAVNPWSDSAFIDLTEGRGRVDSSQLAPDVETISKMSVASNKRHLVITSLDVLNSALATEATSVGQIRRQFTLRLKAGIQRADLNGNPVVSELTQARLRVNVALLAVVRTAGGETQRVVWEGKEPFSLQGDANGLFRTVIPVAIDGNDAMTYRLAVQLVPQGAPEGLVHYEGLFQLGSFADVTGADALRGDRKGSNFEGNFNFAQLASLPGLESDEPRQAQQAQNVAPSSASSLTLPSGVSRNKGAFFVEKLTVFKFSEEFRPAWDRQAQYTVQLCLKDRTNNGRPPMNVEFMVTRANGQVEKMTTSSNPDTAGCLGWVEMIPYNWYEMDRYFTVDLKIVHKESGSVIERQYAVNPWLNFFAWKDLGPKDDPSAFRENRLAVQQLNSRKSIPSRVIVDGFSYRQSEERQFRVDEFLNLTILNPFRIEMQMRVARESDTYFGVNNAPQPLPASAFLVKAVVYLRTHNAIGEKVEVIEPIEWAGRKGVQIMKAVGGAIRGDLWFPIKDLFLMRSRARLVIQILPLDAAKLPPEDQWDNLAQLEDKDLMNYVANTGSLINPVFVAPLWINEGGGPILIPADELGGQISGPWRNLMKKRLKEEDIKDLQPLYKVSVDDLLSRASQQHEQYVARMREKQSLPAIAKDAFVDYVTLNNEQSIVSKEPRLEKTNRFLPVKGGAEKLIKGLNLDFKSGDQRLSQSLSKFALPAPVTKRTMSEILEGRRGIDKPMAARLCLMYMNDFLPSLNAKVSTSRSSSAGGLREASAPALFKKEGASGATMFDGPFATATQRRAWFEECVHEVESSGVESVFVLERTLRIFDLVKDIPDQDYVSTCQAGVNIGAGISYGRSESDSTSWSLSASFDPLAFVTKGLSMAANANHTPATVASRVAGIKGSRGASFLSAATGSVGVSAGVSRSWSNTSSIGHDSAYSVGIAMDLDKTELKLTLKKFEHCATVRMNPRFWEERRERMKALMAQMPREQAEEMAKSLVRGVMICQGQIASEKHSPRPKQMKVMEHFYAVAQGWLTGTQGDVGDVRNLPWLIGLRGVRDYSVFMGYLADERSLKNVPDRSKMDPKTLPIERLSEAYSRFRAFNPTSPGVYSAESARITNSPANCPQRYVN